MLQLTCELHQISTFGFTQSELSSEPALIYKMSSVVPRENSAEPHLQQNFRSTAWPLDPTSLNVRKESPDIASESLDLAAKASAYYFAHIIFQ